jgi:hypothetical protein
VEGGGDDGQYFWELSDRESEEYWIYPALGMVPGGLDPALSKQKSAVYSIKQIIVFLWTELYSEK